MYDNELESVIGGKEEEEKKKEKREEKKLEPPAKTTLFFFPHFFRQNFHRLPYSGFPPRKFLVLFRL